MPSRAERQHAPRCYFSLRSPYSWLALRNLDAMDLGVGSHLRYIPYFEPSEPLRERLEARGGRFLYSAMSRERHRYILADVKRILIRQGLNPVWPVDAEPDWSIPHLAFLACPRPALSRSFLSAAMEARWLRGEASWSWDWVANCLTDLSERETAALIIGDAQGVAIADQAVDGLYQAYRDDVFGVPFFVTGREKFWGADRLDAFLEADRAA